MIWTNDGLLQIWSLHTNLYFTHILQSCFVLHWHKKMDVKISWCMSSTSQTIGKPCLRFIVRHCSVVLVDCMHIVQDYFISTGINLGLSQCHGGNLVNVSKYHTSAVTTVVDIYYQRIYRDKTIKSYKPTFSYAHQQRWMGKLLQTDFLVISWWSS